VPGTATRRACRSTATAWPPWQLRMRMLAIQCRATDCMFLVANDPLSESNALGWCIARSPVAQECCQLEHAICSWLTRCKDYLTYHEGRPRTERSELLCNPLMSSRVTLSERWRSFSTLCALVFFCTCDAVHVCSPWLSPFDKQQL
jgi:hypothetical protein